MPMALDPALWLSLVSLICCDKLCFQIEILLGKTANFDELMAAAAAAAESGENGDIEEHTAWSSSISHMSLVLSSWMNCLIVVIVSR